MLSLSLLLALKDLSEQLVLGCHELSKTGRWRWRWRKILLIPVAIPLTKALLVVVQFPNHLQKRQLVSWASKLRQKRTDS
jgi:hypothetical protein